MAPTAAEARARRKLAADAWGALLQVHALLVPALDRDLQDAAQLPLTWYDVLLELAAADDRRLRMSDLADRVVLSRTRVSRLVDDLVAAGLVSKAPNLEDGRSAYAELTAAGMARFKAAAPTYLDGIDARFGALLTGAELRTITKALGRVLAAAAE